MTRALILLFAAAASAQTWVPQVSGSTASLRGVSAVNAKVVWASGSGGTYLRTTDGGATWRAGKVPNAEKLDFRAVRAVNENTAYLLSIGTGDLSRVYKTTDGGANWKLQLTNPDAKGFFDCLSFWDARHGILGGDPVDGHIVIFTTADGGEHWQRQQTPPGMPNEGLFAASNTTLIVTGSHDAWLGTGSARVFHSKDNGRTWAIAVTPLRHDSPNAGIFSLAFSDAKHGVAVGGDYSKTTESQNNIALTADGGRTWVEPAGQRPAGFRSAVAYLAGKKVWIATGPSGSDVSSDGGATWKAFDSTGYNAITFVPGGAGWAAGPRGRIAAFRWN